jgi:hypothetical protein
VQCGCTPHFQLIGSPSVCAPRGFREHQLGGDYGCAHLVLLVIALLVVGARRLQHLRYVAGDVLCSRGSVVWPVFPAIAPW